MSALPGDMGDAAVGMRKAGRIIAVANLKGGTGKSTLAVNLASLSALAHGSAALVDADPQGTAAAWFDGAEPDSSVAGLTVQSWPLAGAVEPWADRIFGLAERHARVVIDMPPQFGPGFEAVLNLVDALVIPVTPSAIDLRATAKTLQRVRRVQRQRVSRPACLLVPNRVDQRTAVGRTIQRALRDLDLEVAPPIAQRSTHSTAFSARQWIGAHAPGSPAFREIAAVAATLEKLLSSCPLNDYVSSPQTAQPPVGASPHVEASRRPNGGILATLLAGFRLLGRPQSG